MLAINLRLLFSVSLLNLVVNSKNILIISARILLLSWKKYQAISGTIFLDAQTLAGTSPRRFRENLLSSIFKLLNKIYD